MSLNIATLLRESAKKNPQAPAIALGDSFPRLSPRNDCESRQSGRFFYAAALKL